MWIQYLRIYTEEAIYQRLSTTDGALSRYEPVMCGDRVFVVVLLCPQYGTHPLYVWFSSPCLETCCRYSSNQSAFVLYVSCQLMIHNLATRLGGSSSDSREVMKSTWQLLQWCPMGVLSFDISFVSWLVCIFRIFYSFNKCSHTFSNHFLCASDW